MAKKLTNSEIYNEIAAMSETEAATYGITPAVRSVAGQSDAVRAAAFSAPYTPLYNGFVGMIAKFAFTALSKAKYTDIYSRHHRNLIQGRPQVGFVKLATAGTGNDSALFSSTPTIGGLTSVITADQPEVITLYETENKSFVARVPISPEDVKNAVTNEYGISDLIEKTRRSAEDKIINDRNAQFDAMFTAAAQTALLAGSGAETQENAGKAVKKRLNLTYARSVASGTLKFTDDDLTLLYTEIKKVYFSLTGRPTSEYNALGVMNNVDKESMVCYIDADVLAEMETRVAQAAYNLDKLEQEGLKLVPTKAPYLGKAVTSGDKSFTPLLAIGSADYLRDYPLSDYSSEVPVDRGVIHSRFFDDQFIKAGYEPFVFVGVEVDTVVLSVGSGVDENVVITVDGVVVHPDVSGYLTIYRPAAEVTFNPKSPINKLTYNFGGVTHELTSPTPGKIIDVTGEFNTGAGVSGSISVEV